MKFSRTITQYAILCASIITLTLAGCGGGGGGGSGSSSSGSTLVSITGANATAAASAAGGSVTVNTGSATSGAALIGGAIANPDGKKFSLVKFASWQLSQLPQMPPPVNLIGAATLSGSLPCSGGGNISYSYNDADNNGRLSIGETLTATFNSCVDPALSGSITGGLTLAISALSGTPGVGAWSTAMTMTFSNLTVDGETLAGDTAISLSTSDSVSVNATLTGSSLSYTKTTGTSETISGYNFSVAYNNSSNAYTVSGTGTTGNSSLGGTVTFNTTSAFAGNFNNNPDNPISGVLVATGANNSKVRLTALSNLNVQIEVDANGDGTYESSSTTTWAALDAI